MATWKWRIVRKVLLDKGFRLDRSTNHEYYRLFVEGKASSVRTKVSHGNKGELNSNSPLMNKYQAQLRLDKKRLEDLLDCPLTGDEYVRMLVANGELKP